MIKIYERGNIMNRVKGFILRNSKKIIVICSIVIVIFVVLVYYLTHNKSISLVLNKEEIVVEYGEVVKLEPEIYVNFDKISKEKKDEILKEIKVTSDIPNEEGKEYPSLGKYAVVINYQQQTLKKQVVIKDSKAPVFNDINEITFEEGSSYNYGDVIQASDLQEITYSFDDGQVKSDVPGEYTMNAIAKDGSGNQTEKEIKITVTAKPIVKEPETSGSSTGSMSITRKDTSKPSSKPSAGEDTSNNSGTSTSTNAQEKPHIHENSTFGNYFESEEEDAANKFAYDYLFSEDNINYSGYGLNYCSCGLIGVVFY